MRLSASAQRILKYIRNNGCTVQESIKFISDATQPGTVKTTQAAVYELQGKGLLVVHKKWMPNGPSTYSLVGE